MKNCKKVFIVIAIIVAIAGIAAAAYLAITKLMAKKEPEYYDDNDFFECDNELEIVEVSEEAPAEEVVEETVEEAPAKEAPKAKKKAAKEA